MSSKTDRQQVNLYCLPKTLADALNKSERELLRLATYYHQIGRVEKAEEIYRTILKINKRTSRDLESAADSTKMAS